MSKRLNKIREHLRVDDENDHQCEDVGISREETRSFTEWGSDLYNMATQSVVLTEKHGGDLAAEVLKAHGVEFIFTLSGGHISPVLVSSEQRGIRIVDVRHEVNAVFAADAVGRLTGVPGVAAVTAGPGVTNTVTAVKNAAMAQSPVVLLGGAAATVMQGRGALQDIDHLAFLEPICKWVYSCRTVRDIVPALRRAFQVAVSDVPGVVFIELPLDVLYPALEMLPQAGTHERLRARDLQGGQATKDQLSRLELPVEAQKARLTPQQYVESKPGDSPLFLRLPPNKQAPLPIRTAFSVLLRRLHAGAFHDNYDFGPLPVTYPKPNTSDVQKAAELLRKAKRPVFVFGSQSMLHGERGAKELAKAIETLGAPCFLGGMSRGLMGRNHPLHIRQNRGKALKKCDLVCLVGVIADFRLDYGRALPGKVPIISINRSLEDLYKNTGIFWNPTLPANADPAEFVIELAKLVSVSDHPHFTEWCGQLKSLDGEKEAANREMSKAVALGRDAKDGHELVNPLHLCFELENVLEDDSILVADGGDFVATCSYITRPRGPLAWLDPGAFGTLGVGGGFALGAALVHPEKQVYIIWGDGSCMYSLAEFDTYTRHGVQVIAIVGNDACWTQIEREQQPMFQSSVACVLDYIDYDKAAEALGGRGIAIQHASDNVLEKLHEAQRIVKQEKKSVLVNAHIGRTNFREGSLSV